MSYTPDHKRMAKNTALLYFRMFLMMCITLYTSRVVLRALGIEDYGIYNVVGGVVLLFSFINDGMTVSTLRFLTFELGRGDRERLHAVFSTSINIHLLISLLIILLGETVGLWFLLEKMVIPPERMTAALWCYQFSIFTAVVTIMSFPYYAAIVAHEKMSAFAYISILDATLKLLLVYLLMAFSYDRLILYGILFACEKVMIRMIYNIYCVRNFEECHYKWIHQKGLFKEMVSFAGWNVWGNFAYVAVLQGINILLNLFFGPSVNAARAVSLQVQGAVSQFAKNFQMAINPQITKSYSSGQINHVYDLIYMSSKITFYLLLILCIPLITETPEILRFWLRDYPDYSVAFIRVMLLTLIVELFSNPLSTSIEATGEIKKYSLVNGSLILLILPIAYLALWLGCNPWSVFIVQFCVAVVACLVRLYIVMYRIKMSIMDYCMKVIRPCVMVLLLSSITPFVMKFIGGTGLLYAILTIFLTILAIIFVSFMVGLNYVERTLIKSFFKNKFRKRKKTPEECSSCEGESQQKTSTVQPMTLQDLPKGEPIPKVIHYCWFGGNPLPELAQKCIASWRKFLPDYEIKEWNEKNFDVYQATYVEEAYRLKKYAHVSDYARFWILYHYGGIYFDTDVEVIRPLDDILARGSFLGFECQEGTLVDNPNGNMAAGLGMGVAKGHPFFGQMVEYYNHIHFVCWNGKSTGNVTPHATQFLDFKHKQILEGGIVYVNDLLIYPEEYFCPLNYYTNELNITENTRTIHHYMASWVDKLNRWQSLCKRTRFLSVRARCLLNHLILKKQKQ